MGLLGLALGLWVSAYPYAVTRANLQRIEQGMTRAEVEAIVGSVPSRKHFIMFRPIRFLHGKTLVQWDGGQGAAVLLFDTQGRVGEKKWIDRHEDSFDRIRRWLHP
jgi:hypothetical protein